MPRVQIGFFRDFKSSDTVLIEGDSSSLRLLGDTFRALATNGRPVAIHTLPFVEIHHGIRILATLTDVDRGTSMNNLDVSWERSLDGWRETAEKLDALAETDTRGHQYLDSARDQITVEVSCGEYGESWWAQNG